MFLSFCQVGLGGVSVLGVVGGLVFEHGEDEVAAATGDADDGGVVVFAFGSFALVVGLGVRVVEGGNERVGFPPDRGGLVRLFGGFFRS